MLPLCEELRISVNEQLSGEKLDNAYVERTEENIIELMKEKEKTKPGSRKLVLWQIGSVAVTIVIWIVLLADSNVIGSGRFRRRLRCAA